MSTMARRSNAGGRRQPVSRYRNDPNLVFKRTAWFLKKFLCQDFDTMNMDTMREHLSTCKGIKTRVKMTPEKWSYGRRSLWHKLPRQAIPLSHIHSLEQDEKFVNVLLCVCRMVNIPGVTYEVVAYKFHNPTDVLSIATKFQEWTGTRPITRSENGSILGARPMSRSASLHTLSMPGRPTNGSFVPDKWVVVNQGVEPRRYAAGSMADLSSSDIYYGRQASSSAFGGRRTPYNGAVETGVFRRRAGTPAGTEQSDEGNGSLSSDHVTYREVATSIRQPLDPHSQETMHFQRLRPYNSRAGPLADVGCQVNLPGSAGRSGMMNGYLRSTNGGIELDDDSTLSDDASSFLDDDPGPPLRLNDNYMGNGIAVAHVNGFKGHYQQQHSRSGSSYDDVDYHGGRRGNGVPEMSTTVSRVYSRPPSEKGFTTRRSRYQSDSGSLLQVPAATRSRSVEPHGRYPLVSTRSDVYRSMDRLDTASVRSTQSNSVLIHPRFEKHYAPRSGTATQTLQVPAHSGGGYRSGTSRRSRIQSDRW